MISDWCPNSAVLDKLEKLLTQEQTPSRDGQQKLLSTLTELQSLEDGSCYLVMIYMKTRLAIEVRQSAGLLVKSFINRACGGDEGISIPDNIMNYIQKNAMDALSDEDITIRNTAGQILCSIVASRGPENTRPILELLHGHMAATSVQSTSPVFASWSATSKIVEDLLYINTTTKQRLSTTFVTFLTAIADMSCKVLAQNAESAIVLDALDILNNLYECSRSEILGISTMLNSMFGQYWDGLGSAATRTETRIKVAVLVGMNIAMLTQPHLVLNNNHRGALLSYILEAAASEDYSVRFEAINFWTKLCQRLLTPEVSDEERRDMLNDYIQRLVVVLSQNTVYTDADVEQMDPLQFTNDHTDVPDVLEPSLVNGPDDDDDDDSDSGGVSFDVPWGSHWTVRKGAALTLEHLSDIYAITREGETNIMTEILIPILDAKLNSEDWKIRESGIIAFGAVAPAFNYVLFPGMPSLWNILRESSKSTLPLLRCICSWAVGRCYFWYTHPGMPEEYLSEAVDIITNLMVDKNKWVQHAAIEALYDLVPPRRENQNILEIHDILRKLSVALTTGWKIYKVNNIIRLSRVIEFVFVYGGDVVMNSTEFVDLIVQILSSAAEKGYDPATSGKLAVAASLLFHLQTQRTTSDSIILQFPGLLSKCEYIISDVLCKVEHGFVAGGDEEFAVYKSLRSSCDIVLALLGLIQSGTGNNSRVASSVDQLFRTPEGASLIKSMIQFVQSSCTLEDMGDSVEQLIETIGRTCGLRLYDPYIEHIILRLVALIYPSNLPNLKQKGELIIVSLWAIVEFASLGIGENSPTSGYAITGKYLPVISQQIHSLAVMDTQITTPKRPTFTAYVAFEVFRLIEIYPSELTPMIEDVFEWLYKSVLYLSIPVLALKKMVQVSSSFTAIALDLIRNTYNQLNSEPENLVYQEHARLLYDEVLKRYDTMLEGSGSR